MLLHSGEFASIIRAAQVDGFSTYLAGEGADEIGRW